jgi:hypothetical protein
MDQRFSLNAPQKVDKDYKRTKDDFYRMELDKLDDVHPLNRPHMRKAYFAYPQNTPGSKKLMKIMLPMLKLETNYGFHELFLKYNTSTNIN